VHHKGYITILHDSYDRWIRPYSILAASSLASTPRRLGASISLSPFLFTSPSNLISLLSFLLAASHLSHCQAASQAPVQSDFFLDIVRALRRFGSSWLSYAPRLLVSFMEPLQSSQYHFADVGGAFRPTHSRWNHCFTQSSLSQATISP
jgi:hypothetical protein